MPKSEWAKHLVINYWLFRIRSTWRWYRSASTRYDVHSPFLASLVARVIVDRRPFYAYSLVQQIRKYWKKHPGQVSVLQQGAPSKVSASSSRPVDKLVAASAIPPNCGKLLFRLALWTNARTIIELGTNAGISSLYLHLADRRAVLHTIEGNPEVAALAKKTFSIARCTTNLQQHVGTFAEVLPGLLQSLASVDLLFIDGDHRYQSTLDYVRQTLPSLTEAAVVVVADIHWSEGMEKAWKELKGLAEVTASLDVYHFGILFFKPGVTPGQHLTLISTKWKPWRVGFFS